MSLQSLEPPLEIDVGSVSIVAVQRMMLLQSLEPPLGSLMKPPLVIDVGSVSVVAEQRVMSLHAVNQQSTFIADLCISSSRLHIVDILTATP